MAETYGPFTRETLLDLTVNIIPMGIIAFFMVLVVVYRPWGEDPFEMAVTFGLHVVPFAALALLTYVSGLLIQRDEGKTSETEGDQSTEH